MGANAFERGIHSVTAGHRGAGWLESRALIVDVEDLGEHEDEINDDDLDADPFVAVLCVDDPGDSICDVGLARLPAAASAPLPPSPQHLRLRAA